jgi:hypothetical protein
MFSVDLKPYALDMVPSTRAQTLPSSKPFKCTSEDVDFDPRWAVGTGTFVCSIYELGGPTVDGYTFSRICREVGQPSPPLSRPCYLRGSTQAGL